MAPKIRVQYNELAQAKQAMLKEAEAIRQMTSGLKKLIGGLREKSWSGHGLETFLREMDEVVLPAMTRLSTALVSSAALMDEIQRIFQATDEAVGHLFRQQVEPDLTSQIVTLEKALQRAEHEPPMFGVAINSMIDIFYASQASELMGRHIYLKQATKDFTAREKLLILETFSELPKTLREKSRMVGLVRHDTLSAAAANYHPARREINLTDAAYGDDYVKRLGLHSAEHAFQAVLLHELTHSIQYDEKGNFSKLLADYSTKFGYRDLSMNGTVWHYNGQDSDIPGADDPSTMYPQTQMNPQEDMAEAVVFYRYAPERLSKDRYDWVRDNIYSGQEFK
jgi:WXG100 family type VII secretion target